MQGKMQRVTPFFWFDDQAEEAVTFYTSIFPNSSIGATTRYSAEVAAQAGRKAGSVMTIGFKLDGQDFAAINGGPHFQFNGAISLVINCEGQAEVDHYWSRLGEGGDPAAQQCGWLKDKYGVSWQVVPTELPRLLSGPDSGRAQRAGAALMKMKKIDLDALRAAAAG